MATPLATRYVPADFYTSNHYIFGQVKVTNTGVLGLLCDPNTSCIEVNDGSLARIIKPDKVLNYTPAMWIVKAQLIAVVLNKRDYVGQQPLVRGGYSHISEYAVQITTPVYEFQGSVEYSGRFEFPAVLGEGTNAFLTLYNASMSAVLFPALHVDAQVILINRNLVDSLVNLKKSSQES